MISEAVMWSKDNCPFCLKAKTLLALNDIVVVEKKIGDKYTRDDLLEVVPDAKTVPQIFVDGIYVGGYTELNAMIGIRYDGYA